MFSITNRFIDIDRKNSHIEITEEDINGHLLPAINLNKNKEEQASEDPYLTLEIHIAGNKNLAD